MRLRSLLVMLTLVVGTTAACSSGSETAKKDEEAATQKMAQTEEEGAEADTDEDAQEAGEAGEEMAQADADAQAQGKMAGKQKMMQHCPMAIEGTDVAVENVDTGVAMVFTTTGDADELRERVQWMAEHHDKMKGHGKMHAKKHAQAKMKGHGKKHGKKGMGKMHGKGMPKATVQAEQVDKGMKLVFTAEDEAQVQKLQQHMAQHAERVKSGTCPMKYNKTAETEATTGDEAEADSKADGEAKKAEAKADEG